MTDPKLREARIAEAERRARQEEWKGDRRHHEAAMRHLIDLIEQDWRPEPEVDAVTLAAREFLKAHTTWSASAIDIAAWDHSTPARAFRAGHAHALANCADVKRMDWLGMRDITVHPGGGKDLGFGHFLGGPNDPLRVKIDRAMEGGE